MQEYWLLWLAAGTIIFFGLVITPGYVPLLVIGLLMPFSIPLPIIWNLPFLFLALGTCIIKYWLERGLTIHKPFSPISTVNWSCGLFFTWVFLRYCMKPSIPNVMGFGRNVTGFRAWLSYALCFGVLFFLGRFVGNRQGLVKLIRWLVFASVFFTILLLAATFSKSMFVAEVFTYLGMYVTAFDNGFLRFVALPEYGLILFCLALLPNLLPVKRLVRLGTFAVSILAIILGGNRSSLGTALIIAIAVPFVRRRFLHAAATIGAVLAIAIGGFLAGPILSQLPETGFTRALALVSPDLAKTTGGDNNMEWRELRWQRALEGIRQHPFVGEGYGGLENVSDSITAAQVEETSEEMSLATGGVHNGYLACALALGTPAALLFICILIHQIILNTCRAFSLCNQDLFLAEAHCFVCVYLLVDAAAMFIGSDINEPTMWFFIALGIFVGRLRRRESKKAIVSPAPVQSALPGQLAWR
jgi:O-antigen ligase